MARHLSNSGIILPVIRKVICRDDAYICSICRSEFRTKVEANNCLNHCWYDVQTLYPVVLRKLNGRHVVFRCHYCCRDYPNETEALTCAHRCQSDRNRLHVHEQLLNDLPIEAPSHRPSRIRLVALKSTPARAKNPAHGQEQESIATDDLADEVEIPEHGTESRPRKRLADFPKQWIRMDAKYQCCYCKSLFFTKMETEACFKEHFDADGLEKSPV